MITNKDKLDVAYFQGKAMEKNTDKPEIQNTNEPEQVKTGQSEVEKDIQAEQSEADISSYSEKELEDGQKWHDLHYREDAIEDDVRRAQYETEKAYLQESLGEKFEAIKAKIEEKMNEAEYETYISDNNLEKDDLEQARIYDMSKEQRLQEEAEKLGMTVEEYNEYNAEYGEYLAESNFSPETIEAMDAYYQREFEREAEKEAESVKQTIELEEAQEQNRILHLSPNQTHYDEPNTSKSTMEVDVKDYGDMIQTDSNSELGGEELARIADEKGWKEIYVEGSEEFKRSAWREAVSRDMEVQGYRPDEKDVHIAKEKGIEKGLNAEDAARISEDKGIKSGYGSKELSESQKAQALKSLSHSEIIEKYPELAKEVAVIKASEALINDRVKDPDVRSMAIQNIRNDVAQRMDAGQKMPDISISQVREIEKVKEKETEQTL